MLQQLLELQEQTSAEDEAASNQAMEDGEE